MGWGKRLKRRTLRKTPPIVRYPQVEFKGWPWGLNTERAKDNLLQIELAECKNLRPVNNGMMELRPGIQEYRDASELITSSTVKIIENGHYILNGVAYEYVETYDSSTGYYQLYRYSAGSWTSIVNTNSGRIRLLEYKDVVLIMDSRHLTYISADYPTTPQICYDDGTGSTGYMFDSSDLEVNSSANGLFLGSLDVGNSIYEIIGRKFTTPAWTPATLAIPPTTITVVLRVNGDGTTGTDNVPVTVGIRNQSGILIASKVLIPAPIALYLSTTYAEYSATFTTDDILGESYAGWGTRGMLPSTPYYLTFEYDNAADLDNCVSIAYWLTPDNDAATVYNLRSGTWHAATTEADMIASLRPGPPPKADLGTIFNGRPWVRDADDNSIAWYGNLSHLDWSTQDGGGYVSMDSAAGETGSRDIGAMVPTLNNLIFFGTKHRPFMSRLTGSSPSNYSMSEMYSSVYACQDHVVEGGNSIFMLQGSELSSLAGVVEYGDFRRSNLADQVRGLIATKIWGQEEDIALGFWPHHNQVFLASQNYHRVLVLNLDYPFEDNGKIKYPWCEYEFVSRICGKYTDDLSIEHAYGDWVESYTGKNEYYLNDPGIERPNYLTMKGVKLEEGTIGSLLNHEWCWGDNDDIGDETIYFRSDGGNPNNVGGGLNIRAIVVPVWFDIYSGGLIFGTATGMIYQIPKGYYDKDLSEYEIEGVLKTGIVTVPFSSVRIGKYYIGMAGSRKGKKKISSTLDIYRNEASLPDVSATHGVFYDYPANNPREGWAGLPAKIFQAGLRGPFVQSGETNVVGSEPRLTFDRIILETQPCSFTTYGEVESDVEESGSTPIGSTDVIELEGGGYIELEDGGYIDLEDS